MKNMVVLYYNQMGELYCQQISEKGKEVLSAKFHEDNKYWDEGGVIEFDELEEILNKDI
jgi:hypothetical protein